ncbi:APG6-domain-containing protein [Delitschia confertaspora ATCC 74209]|uniref:APG6-domain-containing protein n=1 Tax=Delitschia confertaspora ATCC 74209 TaxID=1513339 RepID=A0A9P4JLE2_9PLEO|nr:APG6-domain-containing protein [Delitschia confertaspora ATCC 74209]
MANDTKPKLFCQKCRTPIQTDPSIEQLNPASFKLLTDSTVPPQQQPAHTASPRQSRPAYPIARRDDYQHAIKDARNPTFRRSIQTSARYSQHGSAHNPAMSFIDVHMSESMVAQPSTTIQSYNKEDDDTRDDTTPITKTRRSSQTTHAVSDGPSMADNMETVNRMFEILSARSDIDHPICVECTELVVDGLQKRLTIATKERDAYVDYLRRANTDVPSEEERQAALSALKSARKKEAVAKSNLEKLEQEKAELDTQLAALELEARELDTVESAFWRDRNAFSDKLSKLQDEKDTLSTRHAHDTQTLTHLQRRYVYNDTFNITPDNHFATINGLRLGRLSHPIVEWPEINAAWGQTCLLLATLAERLGYKFQGYELHPMGSTSTVSELKTKPSNDPSHPPTVTRTTMRLYSTGDMPLGLGLWHRQFDNAMVAFLECLRQLGEFVEHNPTPGSINRHGGTSRDAGGVGALGGTLKMPYEIKKDRIHDQSIKLSLNKEESWTKACKYTLTCCKYLLAHANNVESVMVRARR